MLKQALFQVFSVSKKTEKEKGHELSPEDLKRKHIQHKSAVYNPVVRMSKSGEKNRIRNISC